MKTLKPALTLYYAINVTFLATFRKIFLKLSEIKIIKSPDHSYSIKDSRGNNPDESHFSLLIPLEHDPQ